MLCKRFLTATCPASVAFIRSMSTPLAAPLPPPSTPVQIYPFCDQVMQTLLTNLQSPDVHRNIKPQASGGGGGTGGQVGR